MRDGPGGVGYTFENLLGKAEENFPIPDFKGIEIKTKNNDVIDHRLLLRKFNIKSNFLTKQLLDYNAYKYTFPESNKMWRELGYSRNEQFKFWLAEHGLYSLLKLLQRFI